MKYECSQIAPVAAVPCSNEARGSEAYKRKTGGNSLFCTKPALQKMTLFFNQEQAVRGLGSGHAVSHGSLNSS